MRPRALEAGAASLAPPLRTGGGTLLRASPGAYALRCAPPTRTGLSARRVRRGCWTPSPPCILTSSPLLCWEISKASVALLSALPDETPLSVLRYVMHTPGYTKAERLGATRLGAMEAECRLLSKEGMK